MSDYVLSKFSDEENKVLRHALKNASDATKVLIDEDITAAMNIYNRKIDIGKE